MIKSEREISNLNLYSSHRFPATLTDAVVHIIITRRRMEKKIEFISFTIIFIILLYPSTKFRLGKLIRQATPTLIVRGAKKKMKKKEEKKILIVSSFNMYMPNASYSYHTIG
jgi:hypothetical protein